MSYFGIFWYILPSKSPYFSGFSENCLTVLPRYPDWHAIGPKTQRIWSFHDLLLLWLSLQILKWPASSFFFVFCNDQKAWKHHKVCCSKSFITTLLSTKHPGNRRISTPGSGSESLKFSKINCWPSYSIVSSKRPVLA